MTLVAGIFLASIVASSVGLVVRGSAALFQKRWRIAWGLPVGAALLCLAVVLLAAVAFELGPARLVAKTIDPSVKAGTFGESIAELMNVSAWGIPAGLVLGTWLSFKDCRSAAARARPEK